MKTALVVGAGFAGATVARTLADTGEWRVVVIDKREHIGGNAFDYVNERGIRVHKYGPHLWHTSNDDVQRWASQFTEWVPYEHQVTAQLEDGSHVPLPINHKTLEKLFPAELDAFADGNYLYQYDDDHNWAGYKPGTHSAFLETLVSHHATVTNSRQHVENSVGKELCDLFFAPYTKKMWGLELEQLPASVAARIPTNVDSKSYKYFPNDKYQCLPKDGYTAMFRKILDHKNIQVRLSTTREELMRPDLEVYFQTALGLNEIRFDHVFTSEPIDTFFDCALGPLPWRSIKMHTYSVPVPSILPSPVVNFTHAGPHTRVTEWKQLPGHGENPHWTTITAEEPCDYTDNSLERYYPVKTSSATCPNRELYNKYAAMAEDRKDVTFIGRCGMYQYYDMWMVIAQTLKITKTFLEQQHA